MSNIRYIEYQRPLRFILNPTPRPIDPVIVGDCWDIGFPLVLTGRDISRLLPALSYIQYDFCFLALIMINNLAPYSHNEWLSDSSPLTILSYVEDFIRYRLNIDVLSINLIFQFMSFYITNITCYAFVSTLPNKVLNILTYSTSILRYYGMS